MTWMSLALFCMLGFVGVASSLYFIKVLYASFSPMSHQPLNTNDDDDDFAYQDLQLGVVSPTTSPTNTNQDGPTSIELTNFP